MYIGKIKLPLRTLFVYCFLEELPELTDKEIESSIVQTAKEVHDRLSDPNPIKRQYAHHLLSEAIIKKVETWK